MKHAVISYCKHSVPIHVLGLCIVFVVHIKVQYLSSCQYVAMRFMCSEVLI